MTTTSDLSCGTAQLSATSVDAGDGPWTIHGVALGVDDTTRTQSGTKTWTGGALEDAAATLEGKPLTDEHSKSARAVVGEVTDAAFDPELGVVYEAELDDADLAERIANGRLEVSPRVAHTPIDDLEEADDGTLIVGEGDIQEFRHLSIEQRGAAPSASANPGAAEAIASLSVADLRAALGQEAADRDPSPAATLAQAGVRTVDLSASSRSDDAPNGSSGQSSRSVPTTTDSSTTIMTDIDDLEQQVEQYDEPVLVEESDLEETRDAADERDALESDVEDLREQLDAVKERLGLDVEDLAEATGMAEDTLEDLPIEDLVAIAHNAADVDTTDLSPAPQSGDPDPSDGGGNDGPTEEDLQRIEEIDEKISTVGSALPDDRVSDLREEAAELAGTDDYEAAVADL